MSMGRYSRIKIKTDLKRMEGKVKEELMSFVEKMNKRRKGMVKL